MPAPSTEVASTAGTGYDRARAAAPCPTCGHGLFRVREYDASGQPTGRVTLRHPWEGGACKTAGLYAALSAGDPTPLNRIVTVRCSECPAEFALTYGKGGTRPKTCSVACRQRRHARMHSARRRATETAREQWLRRKYQARADARDARREAA